MLNTCNEPIVWTMPSRSGDVWLSQPFIDFGRAMASTSIIFEEFGSFLHERVWLEPIDISDFHRGGRYRKPPRARRFEQLPPGHAMMRDRTGKLVAIDLTK